MPSFSCGNITAFFASSSKASAYSCSFSLFTLITLQIVVDVDWRDFSFIAVLRQHCCFFFCNDFCLFLSFSTFTWSPDSSLLMLMGGILPLFAVLQQYCCFLLLVLLLLILCLISLLHSSASSHLVARQLVVDVDRRDLALIRCSAAVALQTEADGEKAQEDHARGPVDLGLTSEWRGRGVC